MSDKAALESALRLATRRVVRTNSGMLTQRPGCQAALKAKGLKDDITVLVVDAVPGEEHKLPPQLAKDGGGNLQAQSMQVPPAHVHQPLKETEVGHAWRQLLW